jgi:rhomboid protease GluP
MWGFAPVLTRFGRDMGFVPFVMTSCIALFAATLLTSPQIGGFLSPHYFSLYLFGASGYFPVFEGIPLEHEHLEGGRWWTFLTATWLHGGVIHIAMNMMSIRNIAPLVAEYFGASRMIIIYVISGVTGFALSTVMSLFLLNVPFIGSGGFTVGASASIAGLIGAVYLYGHRTGSSGITEQARFWVISFLIMGFLLPRIDNWAHIGGLLGGYVSAKLLDPLSRERLDHFLIALILLVVSAIAIVVSVITALPDVNRAILGG